MPREPDIRENVHFYVDVLLDLYEKTDPNGGAATEEGKLLRARQATEVWWRLHGKLMQWAQSHLAGYCWIDEHPEILDTLPEVDGNPITRDSHELEFLGSCFSINTPPVCDAYTERAEEEIRRFPEIGDVGLRRLIAELLMSRCADNSSWRWEIQLALRALNHGEVQDLVKPSGGKRGAMPFQLMRWKVKALEQVMFRVGRGMKKYRALQEVGEAIGQSTETLRDWEKELRRDEDNEFDLCCAQLAGHLDGVELPAGTKNLEEKYGAMYHRGSSDIEKASWMLPKLREQSLAEIKTELHRHRAKKRSMVANSKRTPPKKRGP
jgi:hypothetical protein